MEGHREFTPVVRSGRAPPGTVRRTTSAAMWACLLRGVVTESASLDAVLGEDDWVDDPPTGLLTDLGHDLGACS